MFDSLDGLDHVLKVDGGGEVKEGRCSELGVKLCVGRQFRCSLLEGLKVVGNDVAWHSCLSNS